MEHQCMLTVRSYECDSYQHVNHARYLHYLEYARGEFLASLNIDYSAMRKAGFGIVIAAVDIHYLLPSFFNDCLQIITKPLKKEHCSGLLQQTIFRGAQKIADARVRWVFVNQDGKPAMLPQEFDKPGLAPDFDSE